jgi:hypothetical protein
MKGTNAYRSLGIEASFKVASGKIKDEMEGLILGK